MIAQQEDKRIRRTKKLLRQALTRLMEQKEFQSITVSDVVREADINRGTFYAHYRDVYDLREQIESGMIADLRAMIAELRTDEIDVLLRPVLSRTMDYLAENREIVRALLRAGGSEGFAGKLIDVIEACRMETVGQATTEEAYRARFLATGLVGMLRKWVYEEQPLPQQDAIALMTGILGALLQ